MNIRNVVSVQSPGPAASLAALRAAGPNFSGRLGARCRHPTERLRNVFIALIALTITLSFGCAATSSQSSGSQGEVQEQDSVPNMLFRTDTPPADRYEYVQQLFCSRGRGARVGLNFQYCLDELRRRADAIGGDVLVIVGEHMGRGDCRSCVAIHVSVYRRIDDPAESEQDEEQPLKTLPIDEDRIPHGELATTWR